MASLNANPYTNKAFTMKKTEVKFSNKNPKTGKSLVATKWGMPMLILKQERVSVYGVLKDYRRLKQMIDTQTGIVSIIRAEHVRNLKNVRG